MRFQVGPLSRFLRGRRGSYHCPYALSLFCAGGRKGNGGHPPPPAAGRLFSPSAWGRGEGRSQRRRGRPLSGYFLSLYVGERGGPIDFSGQAASPFHTGLGKGATALPLPDRWALLAGGARRDCEERRHPSNGPPAPACTGGLVCEGATGCRAGPPLPVKGRGGPFPPQKKPPRPGCAGISGQAAQ